MCQGSCSVGLSLDHRSTHTGAPDSERSLTCRRLALLWEEIRAERANSSGEAGKSEAEGQAEQEDAMRRLGKEFHTPGHIFLCIENPEGLRRRRGHTELSVALAKLAGITPVMVGCVMLSNSGDDYGALPAASARQWAAANSVPSMAATAMAGLHSTASLSLPRHQGLRSASSPSGSAKLQLFARPSCRPLRGIRASAEAQFPQGSSASRQTEESATAEVSETSCTRRSALLAGLVATACGEAAAQLLASPPSAAAAEAEAAIAVNSQTGVFSKQPDVINACVYEYPLKIAGPVGDIVWIETRKPERYSSAAPLSPDARLRIVSERLVPLRSLVISVSVSPPNAAFLPSPPPPPAADLETAKASGWTAVNVARSVLADRTSPRMTSIQRLQETILGDVYEELRTAEGASEPLKYYLFEYVNQKSPTMLTGREKDVFRRSLAVAAEREGYIYCLTVSTVDSEWPQLEEALRTTIDSFRLTAPTGDYVPPWKDPWWFW
ncbi:unnamed protein product [Closterium sp. NIES-64]|nr:unnamed protein product [Closterium sp. NIES-64]